MHKVSGNIHSFRQRCSTSKHLLAFQYGRQKLCTYVMAHCRSRGEKSVWSCRRHTGAIGAEFRVLLASNGDLPYSESSGQQRGCSLVRCRVFVDIAAQHLTSTRPLAGCALMLHDTLAHGRTCTMTSTCCITAVSDILPLHQHRHMH